MKRPILSANVSDIAFILYKKICKVRPKGWFSKFVNDKLIEEYGKDFEKKVNTTYLVELQEKRDNLEKEISKVVKKLKRLK